MPRRVAASGGPLPAAGRPMRDLCKKMILPHRVAAADGLATAKPNTNGSRPFENITTFVRMIRFADCKINLGLDVVARRSDGYHDIDTLMLPVPGLCDAVEVLPSAQDGLSAFGIAVDCPPEKNLCMKALRLMQQECGAGHAHIYLHKAVPSGAGLGGGSADAAATLCAVDSVFGLGLDAVRMEALAARLGSDVPFFITGRPAFASGRGEILTPDGSVGPRLAGMHLLVVKPPFGVGTAEAYAGIVPRRPAAPLAQRLAAPLAAWRETVNNAFENHIFTLYPRLGELKAALYATGAVYASMSGSGSALFGLFDREPQAELLPGDLFVYKTIIS